MKEKLNLKGIKQNGCELFLKWSERMNKRIDWLLDFKQLKSREMNATTRHVFQLCDQKVVFV
jgi:hypothetical protein